MSYVSVWTCSAVFTGLSRVGGGWEGGGELISSSNTCLFPSSFPADSREKGLGWARYSWPSLLLRARKCPCKHQPRRSGPAPSTPTL